MFETPMIMEIWRILSGLRLYMSWKADVANCQFNFMFCRNSNSSEWSIQSRRPTLPP